MDLDTICQNLLLRVVLKDPHPSYSIEVSVLGKKLQNQFHRKAN